MWLITTRFIFVFVIVLMIICDVCCFSGKSSYLSSEIEPKYEESTSTTKPRYTNIDEHKNLLNPIEISDEDTAEFPVKQKRGPNPESTTDLRKRLEQQRLEMICKFCNASELRMKSAMCKRCIPANELLGNTKQTTLINKTEDIPLNQQNKSENSQNPTEFQYKYNNRDEKKINYDNPEHINKTAEKVNENDILEGLNSLETNSASIESAYKLRNPPFSRRPSQTITENSQQSAETKIWKLKENNPENVRVPWNTNEKINNLEGETELPKKSTMWNSDIGMKNKEVEYVEDNNYKPFLPTSAISNAQILQTNDLKSSINTQRDMKLTKTKELINTETITPETNAIKKLDKTNRIITPLIISQNKETMFKNPQSENIPIEFEDNMPNDNKIILESVSPDFSMKNSNIKVNKPISDIGKNKSSKSLQATDFFNTLPDILNTATIKEETNTRPGEIKNTDVFKKVPKLIYRNGNFEIDDNLKAPSRTGKKFYSVQAITPKSLSEINEDSYNNAMMNQIHDLFSKHLNMEPQIDNGKYNNFKMQLSPPIEENESGNKQILMNHQLIETEKNSNNEIIDYNEDAKNFQNDYYNNPLHFTEEKFRLPLILRQNDDGTVQLILDKSEMCDPGNKIAEDNKIDEKNVCKRKTDNEDNLLKRSFNIIDHYTNIPDQQIVSQEITQPDVDLKENFYKHLINQQLEVLFDSLNIEINNSEELHSYIDDLPPDEKDVLKQYLLSSVADLNKNMLQNEQEKYVKTLLQNNRNNRVINDQKQKEENRVYFPLQTEGNNILSLKNNNCYDTDKLKSIIREVIHSELQDFNLCPICSQRKCTCSNLNNNLLNPYSFSLQNEGRVIDKRQNNYIDDESNDSSDVSPHGIVKRRYKIFKNILNWARDIIVHNNTKKWNE